MVSLLSTVGRTGNWYVCGELSRSLHGRNQALSVCKIGLMENFNRAIMFNPATINLISKKNKIVSTDILANRIYHAIFKGFSLLTTVFPRYSTSP